MNYLLVVAFMIFGLVGYTFGRCQVMNDIKTNGCWRGYGDTYCIQGQWESMYTDGTHEIVKEILK